MNDINDCDDSLGDCGKAALLIDRYIDNQLDDNERHFIDTHLADCPGCVKGFTFESAFHSRITSLSPVAMPDEVKNSIVLALGFPGMTSGVSLPTSFGIPQTEIPRGEIPRSPFFSSGEGSSFDDEGSDD